MNHNDLDIENWKDCDINTDSLWLIKERDKSGKHANFYHGNSESVNQTLHEKGETVFDINK